MLELEKHITASYFYVIGFVYHYIKNSKFTMGEVAKQVKLEQKELEKMFIDGEITPKLLLNIMAYLSKEAEKELEKIKELKTKDEKSGKN